jgi:hypothetical protein
VTARISVRAVKLAVAISAVVAISAITAGSASASLTTIYSNIAKPLPKNTPSLGYEATATSEFGGAIEAESDSLTSTKVTVGMSSWACESGAWNEENCVTTPGAKFTHPITLHIYSVGPANSVGVEVARLTQTFKIPYRPSDSPKCPEGGWSKECVHGKLFKIKFSLRGVALPRPAIVSVSYNTSHYGAEPTGCTGNCPEDSLNVGVEEGFEEEATGPFVGTQPLPEDAYLDSTSAGSYCNGAEGTGVFRLDAGCWGEFQPMFAVETK